VVGEVGPRRRSAGKQIDIVAVRVGRRDLEAERRSDGDCLQGGMMSKSSVTNSPSEVAVSEA
jgi:hypothetical protein